MFSQSLAVILIANLGLFFFLPFHFKVILHKQSTTENNKDFSFPECNKPQTDFFYNDKNDWLSKKVFIQLNSML